MRETWVVDFETHAIIDRPRYPPEPVGVAVARLVGGAARDARYYAWGHPQGNNTARDVERGQALLRRLWQDDHVELVFHNSKFDLDVAATHLGLALPPWQRVHDTLFQVYLDDPRAPSLSLKPTAERLLGLPPEERDAVRDWLVEHGVVRRNDNGWGAAIALAPGTVVRAYAVGDVTRTAALHAKLLPSLDKRGMRAAYDRERRIMPLLLENERQGVRVDLPALARDVSAYAHAFERVEEWVRKKLAAPSLDLDKDADLAEALARGGFVKEWTLTKTGRRSTSKKNLQIDDVALRDALAYRAQLATCLRTFLGPWLEQAQLTQGWIHTNWNQVRGDNDKGTRTGRLSSNPNKQNIPNPFKGLKLPVRVPPLPECRSYIVADDEHSVILSADYSQQELRALGHFEDGPLLAAYRANPRLDLHDHARTLINEMLGMQLERKPIKNMGFGLIYGMGLAKLAEQMGVDDDMARLIKRAYLMIFPGLRSLIDDLTRRARLGQPIRTWGGREYFCEPPRMIDNQLRSFEYKMLNLLIQGSSADCTKEAMARYHEHQERRGRFMLQVHDQLLVSVKRTHAKREAATLRTTMESVEFDVPMLVDVSSGRNWATLEELR